MKLEAAISSFGQDVFTSVAVANKAHTLGQRGQDRFGRVYRYALAGASDLVPGNVLTASAQNTAHQQLTATAGAVGQKTIVATLGASAAAENLYKDGLAIIDTTPGLGIGYPIAGHDAVLSSGVITLRLSDNTAQLTALTASSRVSLQRNPYAGVIQAPTTLTGAPVGVCVYPITAAQYGWIGTRGCFGVLIAGTPAVGHAVGVPGSAAGAVVIDGAATSGLFPLGRMCVTGVDGKVQAVMVNLE